MNKRGKNYLKSSNIFNSDRVFDVVNTIFLVIILLVTAYPLLVTVSSSFSSPEALLTGKVVLWPVDFTLKGYEIVIQNKRILMGLGNSVFYTVSGTALNMAVTVLAAYPLSRRDFRPQAFLSLMFAFTMWFSGGIIPSYLLVKDLGMFNTRLAMIVPGALAVWNMIIVRTYFQSSIPDSLFESARIDGCSDIKYLINIVLPLSGPVLAVVTLYYVVSHWNSFFNANLYLLKNELKPLTVILREILLLSQTQDLMAPELAAKGVEITSMNELLKYSIVVISSIPMALLYVFTQKYFTKGIMVGSVKG